MTSVSSLLNLSPTGNHVKFQGTTPSAKKIIEVEPADLTDAWSMAPYVIVDPYGSAVRLTTPLNGVTTDGSKYPRQEFRELDAKGKDAAWDSSKGYHRMWGTSQANHLPLVKPSVVVAQAHGASSDIFELLTELVDGKLVLMPRVGGKDVPAEAVPYNYEKFDWDIVFQDGQLTTSYMGHVYTCKAPKDTKSYFKCGNYAQTNASIDAATEYTEVDLYEFTITHDASIATPVGSVPTVVPPTPVVAKPAARVIIFRHGEKSTSSSTGGVTQAGKADSDHSLTTMGWARAGGIAKMFDELPAPDRLYSSKGTTASLRPTQTITPLAAKFGKTIVTKYASTDTTPLAGVVNALGGTTVICWEHENIPAIAKALGVTGAPTTWADEVFDQVWMLVRVDGGDWSFSTFNEHILAGDK